MSNHREEQQLLRQLLLPIRLTEESKCENVCVSFFANNDIAEHEQQDWLSFQLGAWEDSEQLFPGDDLKKLIEAILEVGAGCYGNALKESYWQCYQVLRTEYFFAHSEARAFLGHALLILDLAVSERLSAAQIAKLLCQRDIRVRFSRQNVADILRILKNAPSISTENVQNITIQDIKDSIELFADADTTAAALFVNDKALELGCAEGVYQNLLTLFSLDAPERYIPYIQILHYQCCIAEYYDHALTDLYEFTPRGHAALWLFAEYPKSLVSAGNPFLNNAKGVEQVSSSWVRSKKTAEQRAGAFALLNILSSLETMGFAARRELGRYLRLWAWRIMQLAQPVLNALPEKLTLDNWNKILGRIAQGNTETFGVLEQRLVDAIAVLKYPESQGWRARGIRSSVNATNISQKKLGDCDFQHPIKHEIFAFEAHGGILSRIYVEEHLRTLKKIIPIRLNELFGIADINKWSATVIFVAHSFSKDVVEYEMNICGLNVKTEYILYKDIISQVKNDKSNLKSYNNFILDTLNFSRTPKKVRDTVLSILNGK